MGALLLALISLPARGQVNVGAGAETAGKAAGKTTDLTAKVFDPKAAKGKATTLFGFHPIDTVATDFAKNATAKVVNPNPFTHNYTQSETHGTTGTATYQLAIGSIVEGGKTKFTIGGKITGGIMPGNNPQMPQVTIVGDIKDPFMFSADPNAQFDFPAGGMDYQFTLGSGTAFPANFAPNATSPGAVAAATSLRFRGRVSPGMIDDPATFWADTPTTGTVDVFDLVLTSNNAHQVTAALTFGTSAAGFFTVDAHTAAQEAAIESAIAGAFTSTGTLPSNLTDVFAVGFVPAAGVTAFTFGTSETINLAAVETPEPAALLLLSAPASLLLLRRRSPRGAVPPA
jgi:hypothetical protein